MFYMLSSYYFQLHFLTQTELERILRLMGRVKTVWAASTIRLKLANNVAVIPFIIFAQMGQLNHRLMQNSAIDIQKTKNDATNTSDLQNDDLDSDDETDFTL